LIDKVPLTNTYNSSGLIEFKEKILFMEIKLTLCLAYA